MLEHKKVHFARNGVYFCNPLSGKKIEMKISFLITLRSIPASMRLVSSMPAIRVGGLELSVRHPA
jgi:hypothetical protein